VHWKRVSKVAERPAIREMVIKHNRTELSRVISGLNSKINDLMTFMRLWTCHSIRDNGTSTTMFFKQHFSEV